MNAQIFPNKRFRRLSSALLAAAAISVFVFFQTAAAQQPQLSLADFLIGLRSKKVTLPERNKLLTEAAKARGVTFELTPEIEKELDNTGADKELIDAIRSKATVVKIAATVPPKTDTKVDPVPVSTPPPPPDHAFYQKRAGTFMAKGEFDSAIIDLNKAIEMNATDSSDYASRGLAYYNKKSYDAAIADYSKAIELKPSDSMTYVNRGFALEK
ncbi:MAG: tetratricopeptide repeat protein, partial [Pyrinomonadaceae bacterium]